MEQYLTTIIIAVLATWFCVLCVRSLSMRSGLVAIPDKRKQHHGKVPLTGGIAMFIGFFLALLGLPISMLNYRVFIAAIALIVFVGVLDDFHEISARVKLLMQLLIATMIVILNHAIIINLGHLLVISVVLPHYVGIVFTIIAIVGVINAFNMIDGVDGLAGSIAIVQFLALLLLAAYAHRYADLAMLGTLVAVVAAFLWLNYPLPWRVQAVTFMGDAGSMFLGLALAYFCIVLSQASQQVVSPVVFLWIMSVPLFDMGSVMLRRLLQRKSPFSPDRDHLHYALIDFGMSVRKVVLVLALLQALLAVIAMVASANGLADSLLFVIIILLFVMYYLLLGWLLRHRKIAIA